MSTTFNNAIMNKKVFVWIALATCLISLVPLIAMQFTNEVSWTALDFIVMALLLFSTGSAFVLVARKVPRKYWVVVGTLLAMAFLYVWAELAVGIFTNLGS